MCDNVGHLIELDVASLVEEVLVATTSSKQPDVAVVRDTAVSLVRHVEVGTLCLRLHRTRHVR